ncbi:NUDIX domain-containing protein [Actinoplanes sp. NPDC000266]
MRLRHGVRAILLSRDDRILLCRHLLADGTGVWTMPGGGIEAGETKLEALRRELIEEVGFVVDGEPPHVWHREVIGTPYYPGYDGAVQDYYLVRTDEFTPRGELAAAEGITAIRWWSLPEITGHPGPDLFGPRTLGGLLGDLLTGGVPPEPVRL